MKGPSGGSGAKTGIWTEREIERGAQSRDSTNRKKVDLLERREERPGVEKTRKQDIR